MNGTARVASATRAKVEDAVDQLGFVPNVLARSLIQARRPSPEPKRSRLAPRLTTVGYLSVDYTARVDVLPHREDRIAAQSIEKSLGGPAADVAVIAANIGPPFEINAELVTAIGDDPESEWALSELAAKKVGTVGIRRRPGQRLSRCFVIVEENGLRTIINEPFDLQESDLRRYVEATPDPGRRHCLHLEGYQLERMLQSAKSLRENGWLISLQATGLPAGRMTPLGFCELAESFDLFVINREAAAGAVGSRGGPSQLVARMAEALAPLNYGTVVLTLGERGVALFEKFRLEPVIVPTPEVEVVDRTGAGDAFTGAFLAVWLNTGDPLMAARYGCVAGSMMVTVPNAQGILPDAATIEGRLLPAAIEATDATFGQGIPKSVPA